MVHKNLKKALWITIVGSLWIKLIEWYVQTRGFTDTSFLLESANGLPLWLFQIIALSLWTALITIVFPRFNKKLFSFAFVPAVWYLLKEILNNITQPSRDVFFSTTILEVILIAIPIGFASYVFFTKLIWKK